MKITASAEGDAVMRHPLVITHPVTGNKALYCNPVYTIGIDGMDESESRALVRELCDHSVRIDFTCRVRWEPGTLTMWDNRVTQHFAINDYAGQRRELLRTTVAGSAPVGVG